MSSLLENLPETTSLAAADLFYVVQNPVTTPTDKKITMANVILSLQANGLLAGHLIKNAGTPVTQRTIINFTGSGVTVTDDGTQTVVTITSGGGGTGDVSSNTSSSVDSEIALFSGTAGKTIKRATGTGIVKITSGVMSVGNVNLASDVTGNLGVSNLGGGTGAAANTWWNGTGAWLTPSALTTALQGKMMVTVGDANTDYPVALYTDIGAAINAAYLGLPSTGGAIFFQTGYSYTTPIVFGTNLKPVGLFGANASSTFLKYTPTSGNAITINTGNPTGHLVSEIAGFTLMGKSTLIAAAQTNTNTSVGIYYGGTQGAVGVNTHDMNVNGFGTNWEIGANAYMLNFFACTNSGGNGGQAARGSLVHINVASNSGERNNFTHCSFTDPGNSSALKAIYIANGGTASNSFDHCSLDDAQLYIGGSDGMVSVTNNHIENAAFATYGRYTPIQGVSSDRSTMIVFNGNSIANDTSGANSFDTIIQHGGQLVAIGNIINNYGGGTISNFVDHSLDNGVATDLVGMLQVQGGALTNIIAGSGGVAYSLATGNSFVHNVANSYSIGMRANGSNTNEFFSGSTTVATFDHSGNWTFGISAGLGVLTAWGTIELGNASDTTLSRAAAGDLAVEGVSVMTVSNTKTVTNKRITKRAPAVTQSATPAINTDVTDVAHITALAQAITSMTTSLTGTPVEGEELRIDFTDNGTARAITWGASFEASTVALPTTTVISTRLDCKFVWNTVTSKWRIVQVA